ncbi:MAG: tRNA (adenosine(37)-N6)-threonylcarbamoyltransferase complex dimerization subunit type 1 TsaB [Bacilli bacterium]|nr:tRNA (adenosine(37)-N6)-threonylcarbamoyltransferase complex dimerization subunit type 1 TsaB [Bacilli bacterium]
MKILFIDTSISFINLAIIDNNQIIVSYHEKVAKDMSNRIVPLLSEAFNKCNFSIHEIDKIFVINGPGSFTGIRIGVTVAKIIAYSLQKEVIPLSSLEFMACTKSNKKYLVPMIDARRGNVYAGIYDNNLDIILNDQLISYEQLSKQINDSYEQISYDFENMLAPDCDILKVINKHLNDNPINPHFLNPNYLKLTEAEEKYNDKISN